MKVKKSNPFAVIAIGFFITILIGAGLLCLPLSSLNQVSISFVDALFTATSCVCVTGLSVLETGLEISLFGQIVMLLLIQVGGIGFMCFSATAALVLGKKLSINEKLVLREALGENESAKKLAKNAVFIAIIFETIGAVLLSIRFIPMFGIQKGIWFSIFHAVSAFCNAGFDLLGNGNSIAVFAGDTLVCTTLMMLIIAGGLGFFVITDLFSLAARRIKRLSLHTRMVMGTTVVLLALGFIGFLLLEWNGAFGDMPIGQKFLNGMFQSVTTRTAGFATVSQTALSPASIMLTCVLMFIGASPAGTGGGVKTTTFLVMILFVKAIISGREDVIVGKKSIHRLTVLRALAIVILNGAFLIFISVLLFFTEGNTLSGTQIVFEAASAFATVGLSLSATPILSEAGKLIIIVAMYMGRIGMITFSLAIAKRLAGSQKSEIKYPEEKVIVG